MGLIMPSQRHALLRKDWAVYAKNPFGGASLVIHARANGKVGRAGLKTAK
jgi:ABC-type phosphonate transport system ATPase subunit